VPKPLPKGNGNKMNWTIQEVPELRGCCVEWAEPGNFYLSRRNVIYHSADLMPPFEKVVTIDAPKWKEFASTSRLAQRLLRFMVLNVIPLNDGSLFVAFDKTVGIVRNGEYQTLDGLLRPCRAHRAGCAVDEKGDVYFGEYLANTERGPVHIYRYTPGEDRVYLVHTFAAGEIRHVHGLHYDEFTNSLWCLTGDEEKECNFFRTSDGFKTMEIVGTGDETWRALTVLFFKDRVCYGTDAEFRDNNIFELDRGSGNRRSLGTVNGTVFYSKEINGNLFFTTTAENAPSQTENVAALWLVSGGECRPIAKFKKDIWHTSLFQFGTIHFPYANLTDELYFHLVAVEGDNKTFRVRPEARA
jgi:hypothetical protein